MSDQKIEKREIVIKAESVSRCYPTSSGDFYALRDVSAEIAKGEFVILKGRSGSGKTTLMNLIGTLDDPTSGTIYIDGKPVKGMPDYKREELRRKRFGFVFQSVSLIPPLTAFENVEFTMRMAGIGPGKERDARVEECLKRVGLWNRRDHYPGEMSGGEQQRVAIARALSPSPAILLADEPTAELDSAMAATVAQLLQDIAHNEGITVLMTTHDVGLMDAADRIIELESGRMVTPRPQQGSQSQTQAEE